ncbi:MAG TPA: TonB-dependent receptor [Bacteroidales bacterium]|nr:TonB-dependent receptor [Bacteroidales bacterium]
MKPTIYWCFTVCLFIVTLSVHSYGQSVIQGYVLDGETKDPLYGASVFLKSHERGTMTDPSGRFILEGISPGKCVLEVSYLGYRSYTHKVTLPEGGILSLDILLTPEMQTLEGIEVTGFSQTDTSTLKLPYLHSEVNSIQIIQTPVTDIGTYIRRIPNVSGIRKGGSTLDPVVRGFKYSQLNVQVDNGQKIEGGCPNRMDPAIAHIEIEDIKSLEILKGPYAFRYGPSFGGIINLQTQKPPVNERFTIDGSALFGYTSNPSGTREHLVLNGGNRLVYFGLSGTNKQNGDYQDGDGNWFDAENKKYNIRGQFGIMPGKDHNLLFSYSYSVGKDVDYPALPMDMREDRTRLMSLDYSWNTPSERFLPWTVKVYRSDVKHTMDNKERPNSDTVVAVTTVQAYNTGGRLESGFKSGNNILAIGADFEYITKDGDRVKTLIMQPTMPVYTEQIWNNAVISNAGLFAEYRRAFSRLDLIASARIDFNHANSDDIVLEKMGKTIYFSDENESRFTNLSASAGFVYWLMDNLSLSLMLGRGVRSPDMVERFITLLPVGYDNYDYLGNPSLKPEANNQADLTGRFQDPGFGSLEINGFYSIVTNYITGEILPPSEQKPATNGVKGVKKYYNADYARFRGFELSYGSPSQIQWYVQFIASYTHASINEAVRNIINESGQVTGTEVVKNDPLAEIPPFESTLTVGYKFLKGQLIPKLRGRFVARQNQVSKAFYESASPGFFVAGISCSYFHNAHFTITGGVENLFNSTYYEHLNRRLIGTQKDFYEPGRNFYINLIFSI